MDGTPLSSSRSLITNPSEIDPYLDVELPGQIRLQALVGIGSMGRVYRAFQYGIDRDVAVKVLHRELTGNAELVGRFHREAKISSRLVHPNVVQVLLTGALSGGEVYLVMEYLDGISLLSALAAQGEGGALPLPRALHIMLQLCDAVGEAHAQGIVHRDLKPENIMLVRRGIDQDFVKVLDFGIARLEAPAEGHVTQAGLIFGTAKYISPEGAEGRTVGPQADVYAIATILYQCLAGRTPFEGDSPMAVLVQQINAKPVHLKEIARSSYVPDPIAQVIMGNLAKNPADRAENARALARELELAAREAGIAVDTLSGSARGDLRLASKQRTKQHQFTAELKQKIASISPAGAGGRPITAFEELPEPGRLAARAGLPGPPAPTLHGEDEVIDLDRSSGPAPTILGDPEDGAAETNDTIHGSLTADGNGVAFTREDRPRARPAPTVPGSPLDDDEAHDSPRSSPRPSSPGLSARPSSPGSAPRRVSSPGVSSPGVSKAGIAAPAARLSSPGLRGSAAPVSHPGTEPPRARSSKPGLDAVPPSKPAGSHPPSPSDGVIEMDAPEHAPEPPRVTWRAAAILLALAIVVPAGAFGAAKLLKQRPATEEEATSLEALLETAQEAMEKRSWAEVKDITDKALEMSPGDRQVLSVRRTAADRVLTEALGKKYAGESAEALKLAKLALAFNPELSAAQHLQRDLEAPAVPASPTGSASASAQPPVAPPGPKGGPKTTPSTTAEPDASAAIEEPSGPDLPPPGPPEITPPGPSSARPWM
ncbi:MAG: protein kinase [Myxococcales bacterium]|nr:protein kinase [Myxococcales bacterium]